MAKSASLPQRSLLPVCPVGSLQVGSSELQDCLLRKAPVHDSHGWLDRSPDLILREVGFKGGIPPSDVRIFFN